VHLYLKKPVHVYLYMIVKWDIAHNKYFWNIKYILKPILLKFYLSKMLIAGLLLEYFLQLSIATFTQEKI